MGQYWYWRAVLKNGDKEFFGTHELGTGLKYLEQFISAQMYTAIMMLQTDTSSLGNGGGDLQMEDIHPNLKALIEPIIGRWSGCNVEFVGDYTQIESHTIDMDNCTNIGKEVATAVLATYVASLLSVPTDTETAKKNMEGFRKFLKKDLHWSSYTVPNPIKTVTNAYMSQVVTDINSQNKKRKKAD